MNNYKQKNYNYYNFLAVARHLPRRWTRKKIWKKSGQRIDAAVRGAPHTHTQERTVSLTDRQRDRQTITTIQREIEIKRERGTRLCRHVRDTRIRFLGEWVTECNWMYSLCIKYFFLVSVFLSRFHCYLCSCCCRCRVNHNYFWLMPYRDGGGCC